MTANILVIYFVFYKQIIYQLVLLSYTRPRVTDCVLEVEGLATRRLDVQTGWASSDMCTKAHGVVHQMPSRTLCLTNAPST